MIDHDNGLRNSDVVLVESSLINLCILIDGMWLRMHYIIRVHIEYLI